MALSHNAVLLVDTADPALKDRIRLVSLRLLNFLACRAGLGHVRWSYRFLNSTGGRCRPPRRSDLRELGPRGWDEFEEELETFWGGRSSGAHSSRALLTQTALMDTLSDFQWDRPDITSPAKPVVLRGRRGRAIPVDEPLKADSPTESTPRNAVYLLAPCPHTHAQLGAFTSASGDITQQQVIDKLLPRSLQQIIRSKRVTLYWMDTSDWAQVWNSSDHSGYWTMFEVMQLVGGKMLPSESLLHSLGNPPEYNSLKPKVPFDSVFNYLICNEHDYRLWFPQQEGVVFFMAQDLEEQWDCAVTLEPISMNQNYLKSMMTITLKGTVENWNQSQIGSLALDTWILQNATKDFHKSCSRFQQLLQALMSRGLHMVADVSTEDDLLPRTGIISPCSDSAAVLRVIHSEKAVGIDQLFFHGAINETNEDLCCELPDVVSSVLSHVYSSDDTSAPDSAVPEWVKQELTQSNHWTTSFVEKWYPLSGASGASSNLMESFRLISAASFDQDEQSRSDQDITNYLSELYQKKNHDESGAGGQGENKKKRGLHRTPVRQKMKTMSRSLQMLNFARLNVKAQKSQPESINPAPNEKSSQVKRRSSDKQEDKGKPPGFKTEEELVSFLKEDYQKTILTGEDSLLSCARNALSAIKSFLKSNGSKQIEVDCMEKLRTLLKTSKSIRQQYGNSYNKEAKLRECQIQAFLRLEICVQCPSIQTNLEELEEIVEVITDMLRIISLMEDPSFLARFLQGVIEEYISTIPKILADLYFSLGIQIPDDLAAALPADDLDDSVTLEGKMSNYSQPSISRVPSLFPVSTEEDQLEELRTRSAKKRRSSTVARHRSVAEQSQLLRQIEMPKRQLNKENSNSNPIVMVEKLKMPLPAQSKKDAEATKVRRNLFVHENLSPSKRGSKMPRSQSVSAVEGLKHKRSKSHSGCTDHYKLLTKKVTETPVHKQISNRLLHKQIKGRKSESTANVSIVEESPEKDIREIDLRRSPRIKQLALTRRNSSFYASQPKSRNLERVHSATMQQMSADQKGSRLFSEVKTPKRLLFGEVLRMNSPTTRSAKRNLSEAINPLCQTPGKTPQKMARKYDEPAAVKGVLCKSPCTPRTPARTPKRFKTPSKSSLEKKSAAKNLGILFSPPKFDDHSSIAPCGRRSERLAQLTPGKTVQYFENPSNDQILHISPCTPHTTTRTPRRLNSPSNNSSERKSAAKNLGILFSPSKFEDYLACSERRSERMTHMTSSKTAANFVEKSQLLCKPTSPYTPHTPARRSKVPLKSSSERKRAAKNLGKYFSPSKVNRDSPMRSDRLAPDKERSPVKGFVSPLKNAEGLTTPFEEGEERHVDPVFKSQLRTPKKYLNITTPIKQTLHGSCTQSKSPCKKLSVSECDIKTPQKFSSVSIPLTPTPKKELFVMLTHIPECTPGKLYLSPKTPTPRKHCFMSPVRGVSKSSFSTSPSNRDCDLENHLSHCPLSPKMPRKALVENVKCSCPQKFPNTLKSPIKSPEDHKQLSKVECGYDALHNPARKIKVIMPDEKEQAEFCQRTGLSAVTHPTDNLESYIVDNTLSVKDRLPEFKDAFVVNEGLDASSLESTQTSESFVSSSQTEESIEIAEAKVVPGEASGLKIKVSITRKPSQDCLPVSSKSMTKVLSASSYGLRSTPDRQQREAAARIGTPELPAKFSTPKSKRSIIPPVMPTYEVELEMQASGLPKLRIKRTDSSSKMNVDTVKRTESPLVSKKRKEDESPFAEKWCNKHALKDPSCVSPCMRSSCNTPGKSGVQMYICQSYTPNRCSSNTVSPCHSDVGAHWTPSPKHKDAINNWPRRKKASTINTTSVLRGDKNPDYTDSMPSTEVDGISELERNKVSSLEEFGLDGVYKLQDKSPVIEWQDKGNGGNFGLKSRKRCIDFVSPTEETLHYIKRKCTVGRDSEDMENITLQNHIGKEAEIHCSSKSSSSYINSSQQSDDDVFNFSGFTPPSKTLKNSLSASGLFALTQSPMLYRGKTPSSKRKEMDDNESVHSTPTLKRPSHHTADSDNSPFSKAVSGGTLNRTYTRKKLTT
ncbi:treslin [Discoglossus pictus]